MDKYIDNVPYKMLIRYGQVRIHRQDTDSLTVPQMVRLLISWHFKLVTFKTQTHQNDKLKKALHQG